MDASLAWPDLAEKLAGHFGSGVMRAEVRRIIAFETEAENASVGLAVSGGADSVCLALLAWSWLPGLREQMAVLHFNHTRRGAESDGDQAFVEMLAVGLDLPFYGKIGVVPPGKHASEAVLRTERLDFFKESGCRVILQGHQRDDILETMLMRLGRGSGVEGLSAPRPVSRHQGRLTFIRPLLNLSREEIRDALRACGVPWREDASNDTGDFLRNRIRQKVVPALREAIGRDPSAGAALSRDLLEEDALALNIWLRELFPEGFGEPVLSRYPLGDLPPAMVRRALYAWLAEQGVVPERQAMTELLECVIFGNGGKIDVGSGLRVCLSQTELSIEQPEADCDWDAQEVVVPGECNLPYGCQLAVKPVQLDDSLRAKILSGKIDPASECYLAAEADVPQQFIVRPWQAGDRYRPLGAPGTRKVQDLFTDAKIPAEERKRLPLVFWGAELVWIPGFAPAESHRISDGTESALWLTYRAG